MRALVRRQQNRSLAAQHRDLKGFVDGSDHTSGVEKKTKKKKTGPKKKRKIASLPDEDADIDDKL